MTALRKQTGGDKTVAAVIARTGKHGDVTAGALAGENSFSDCLAGIFHEGGTGYAARDRQSIGLRHLGIAEDPVHLRTIAERLIARTRPDALLALTS